MLFFILKLVFMNLHIIIIRKNSLKFPTWFHWKESFEYCNKAVGVALLA